MTRIALSIDVFSIELLNRAETERLVECFAEGDPSLPCSLVEVGRQRRDVALRCFFVSDDWNSAQVSKTLVFICNCTYILMRAAVSLVAPLRC